jgi:hypothetical protein
MWDWVDHLGAIVFRASVPAAALSSLVVLAMLGCRQPARRIALARAALLGSLALIPLVGLAPLPRYDVFAALRGAGVLPHPLLTLPTGPRIEAGCPDEMTSAAVVPPRGPWPARLLFGLYLAGTGACLAGLILGFWGLGRLSRRTTVPSPRAQAIYDGLPFPRRRRPRLRVATCVQRPVLVLLGILRPTILIPASLDAETPDATESLRLSFLHELAHAERSDPWFSLAGSLAHAVWFFLPPVWWIRARMHLDHEFLADRRAALGFDAPGVYASSLLGMTTPLRERSGPPARSPSRPAGVVSPLFQRVLMLVQCPFPVEQQPPTWWSWSLPILTLLIAPALACLGLDPGTGKGEVTGATATRSAGPATNTFRMARLAISPQVPGHLGRAAVIELPLRLPEQFELGVEVWGDRATLAHCRVLGQRLGPAAHAPGTAAEPETWHHVLLRRDRRGLSLSVDGQAVGIDPARNAITPQLAIEPAPDRPGLFRNLLINWATPRSPSP